MRTRKPGLTMIEMLVVVSIIALLVGILIPTLTMVRKTAKEVKQKAQFTAIDLGLAAYKNDQGDYPPSSFTASSGSQPDYCGAQKLAEAMVGWDLMGFHPNSAYRSDGLDGLQGSNGEMTYDPANLRGDTNSDGIRDTLTERRDRYVELDVANAFRLGQSGSGMADGLFVNGANAYGRHLAENTHVLCDVFEIPTRKVLLSNDKTVSPGTPILYFKANTASKFLADAATVGTIPADADRSIYRFSDNSALIFLGRVADGLNAANTRRTHPLGSSEFYSFVRDPKVSTQPWPYRPDSYILISAGYDGLYGTDDDICNFRR